jgi:transcriptional regulator with XRE-family HTH domain
MFINIEVERLRHYMSRKQLATTLSVTVDILNDWIKQREAIPADKLRALSQLFGCSVDYLLKERR